MLRLLKRFFSNEKETASENINAENLTKWLEDRFSTMEFNNYLQEYFQQITYLKKQLQEKTEILKVQEISEQDQKQVQDRVKNIVVGRKNHYINEVERFTESLKSLSAINKKNFTINECWDILSFNANLDKELEELAKRTAKSYQAAQHLFFNSVEEIFKSLGGLNKLVKNFEHKVNEYKIKELPKIEDLIINLYQEAEKKKDLEKHLKIKKNYLFLLSENIDQSNLQIKKIKQDREYKELLELKENKKRLEQKYRETEYKVFSFFSKIQKAFKKYERIALDNKLVKNYLDNSVEAFLHDSELKIISALHGLKNNLGNLNLDEKQKSNLLELIEKAESGYLQELFTCIKDLQRQRLELDDKLKSNQAENEIQTLEKEKSDLHNKIKKGEQEISDFEAKLEKINLEENKKELREKIKEVFNVELNIV